MGLGEWARMRGFPYPGTLEPIVAGARVAVLAAGVCPLAKTAARAGGDPLPSATQGGSGAHYTVLGPSRSRQGSDAVLPLGAPAVRPFRNPGALRACSYNWPGRRKSTVYLHSAGPAPRAAGQDPPPRLPEGHHRHLLSPSAGGRAVVRVPGSRRLGAARPGLTVPHSLGASSRSQQGLGGVRNVRARRVVGWPAALGRSLEPGLRS